ncbi:MAG: GNAT family N-acetyltransferase [Mogibacterium sp.]|nr:GNAT family N-acetyltransferase [Mogibacterium sp.]
MEIRQALPQDAERLIQYLRIVGGETDNLTFGAEGFPASIDEEAAFIRSYLDDGRSVMLLAWDDDQIIGCGSISAMGRRMSHRGEIAISVRKSYWGRGAGSALMSSLIEQAGRADIEIISLEVRCDNKRAIHLYEKFGFRRIGTFPAFFRIGNEYIDFDIMVLDLRKI